MDCAASAGTGRSYGLDHRHIRGVGHHANQLRHLDARGFQDIKECTLELGGRTLHIAIAHTLKNAEILMEQVRKGISPYDFIEVMACPCGCIGGVGQPNGTTDAPKK